MMNDSARSLLQRIVDLRDPMNDSARPERQSVRDAARAYLRQGWQPTPLHGKIPFLQDWPNRRFEEAELDDLFSDGCNVGLVLGKASSGLGDVDLDCREARALAPSFLPETVAKFGRPLTPRSHWLYQLTPADFPRSSFADPTVEQDDPKSMIVELRGSGGQTMFPPSRHPDSGETVAWEA
jgi:hypothetical protein